MNKKDKLIKKLNAILIICTVLISSQYLIIIGMGLNFEVVFSNDNKMPVKTNWDYVTKTHFSYQDKTEINHWYFSDIIRFGGYIYSIGDVLIYLGYLGHFITIGLVIKLKKLNRYSISYT